VPSSFGCLQFDVFALIAFQFGLVVFMCVHVLCLAGSVVEDCSLPIKEHTDA